MNQARLVQLIAENDELSAKNAGCHVVLTSRSVLIANADGAAGSSKSRFPSLTSGSANELLARMRQPPDRRQADRPRHQ